jgi:hypothetical protein
MVFAKTHKCQPYTNPTPNPTPHFSLNPLIKTSRYYHVNIIITRKIPLYRNKNGEGRKGRVSPKVPHEN